MTNSLESFPSKCQQLKEHLEHELASIRTGRASPSLIEEVPVQAYSATMKLMELASISAPDHRTLTVEPWDKSLLKDIERGLQEAHTGCSIAVDKEIIRLSVPSLTSESREAMKKKVGKEVEKAKVALRGVREEIRNKIQAQEKNKEISEDEKFRRFEQLDKEVKKFQEVLMQTEEKKVKELEF